jgi:hypothetical protein
LSESRLGVCQAFAGYRPYPRHWKAPADPRRRRRPVKLLRRGPSRLQRERTPVHNRITPRSGRREPRVSHSPRTFALVKLFIGLYPSLNFPKATGMPSRQVAGDAIERARGIARSVGSVATTAQSPVFDKDRTGMKWGKRGLKRRPLAPHPHYRCRERHGSEQKLEKVSFPRTERWGRSSAVPTLSWNTTLTWTMTL